VLVSFKLIYIESERSGVRFEQSTCVGVVAPDFLLPVQCIVHFPKFALESGSFGCLRGFASVLVSRERIITENEPHLRMIFRQQFVNKFGELSAWWALEVPELFERNRSVRITANVGRFFV